MLFELDAPDSGVGSDLDVDDGTVVIDVIGLDNVDCGDSTLIAYTGAIFGERPISWITRLRAGGP